MRLRGGYAKNPHHRSQIYEVRLIVSGEGFVMASQGLVAVRPEEIDIIDLWWMVWRYRWLVVASTAIFAVGAVVLALLATPIWRAEAVVTPVREEGLGGASSLLSQFGGLASLAGVNLSMGDASQEAKAVLRSRRLVEEFIKRHVPLEQLFKGSDEPPTLWFAVKKFRENVLNIEESESEGLTTVTMDWTDAPTATRWANEFVALANEMVRARSVDEANRNITYINEQLKRTDVVEMRRVMYGIIESETKRLMVANGRVEYAFTVVDPAVEPEVRYSPKRTLMVIVGAALGGFLGVMFSLLLNIIERRRRPVIA
jgi:uncharacterized protein involved in exopolysaccharide biosynthesis